MGRGAMSLGLRQRGAPASPIATVELCVGDALLRRPELRRQLDRFRERRFRLLESAGRQQRLGQGVLRVRLLRLDSRVLLERRNRRRRVALAERRVSELVLRPAIRRVQLRGFLQRLLRLRILLFCEHFLPEQQESEIVARCELGDTLESVGKRGLIAAALGQVRFDNETLGLGQIRRRRERRFQLLQSFWARSTDTAERPRGGEVGVER